ncbi:lipoprotein, putative [Aliivibrio fischeri MJ11]|uniref:Lipoprotein, putative n=1 Tax=Aliivibrio fischeri (strain MJ11) TaxID=388396 RepID=B5FGU5_ALIFM|nr:hypothetical protein [Aliivibrio fischeri]ACH65355.1 lipoprotein, putative [Aliivibrio fischeri MJ11]
MYKKILGLSAVLLSGCSTLSSDDDFSDAINEVTRKSNYISIEAKDITPVENRSIGANALRNTSQLTANYAITAEVSPESYLAVELSYFKSSYEYSSVVFNDVEIEITPYSPSTESCSEHCTSTQYFTFPIDNEEIVSSAKTGLTYVVKTQNDLSKLSFTIPAGYFQAVLNEKTLQLEHTPSAVQQPAAEVKVESKDSKPVEMSKYWFDEATLDEQEQFTEWAFTNRKEINTELVSSSKELEMLIYWYSKSSVTDKSNILTWIINKK